MTRDYYSILGVDKRADADTIKKKYRKLATEWHPDKHQDKEKKEEAEEKFKEISEAYSILSDPEKKSNYDKTGSPDRSDPFGFSTTGNPFDILFNMSRHQPSGPRPAKGQSIQLGIELSLVEALFGATHPVSYPITSACSRCSGSGGLEFSPCAECRGVGFKTEHRANMMMQMVCRDCGGTGRRMKAPCPECERSGRIQEFKNFNVVVPPGIHHKTILKLAGQGGRGFNGGPSGDVLVQVSVHNPDVSNLSVEEKETLKGLLSK